MGVDRDEDGYKYGNGEYGRSGAQDRLETQQCENLNLHVFFAYRDRIICLFMLL